jgi:very-short-patch-repair endonuclease
MVHSTYILMLKQNARRLRWQIDAHCLRMQVPIGRCIVDLACLDARLVIEVDGGQHTDAAEADRERDTWLRSQDFRVLRFWNNDVLKNQDGVMQVILEALEATS